jgi:hypothetical protein
MNMKNRLVALFTAILLFTLVSPLANAATLKEKVLVYGPLTYLHGQVIPLGVDPYGYNYQATKFDGSYFNSYANGDNFPPYKGDDAAYLSANPLAQNHWAWPYRNVTLKMNWDKNWLSNEDKDGDGKLDRHYGFPSYRGSGAWLNNLQSGDYEIDGDGFVWNSFTKIVAAPDSAASVLGFWISEDGKEIGSVIWGEFAIIQDVYNDVHEGYHGVQYHSPNGAGFGKYGPQSPH